MRRATGLLLFVMLVCVSTQVYAQAVDNGISALNCVKKKYVGDATTYNPYAAGWKTGGLGLATGGKYNPDAWEAAIQLDIGKEVGCGVGAGKTCRAVVAVPSTGRAAILLINDNGPMCADPATYAAASECRQKGKFARVIDLNKQSMYFLSNGKSGNNVGTLYNVEVAILDPQCNQIGQLGPLTGTDKDAWSKIASSMPATELPNTPVYGNPSNPYSPVSVSPFSSSLGATPSGGSPFGGQQPFGTSPVMPTQPGSPTSPLNVSPSSGGGSGSGGDGSGGSGSSSDGSAGSRAASTIIVQPKSAHSGGTVLISWTSVNMKPSQCVVTKNDGDFATGNEATKRDTLPDSGTTTYVLTCTTPSGDTAKSSASVTITN